MKIDIIEIFNEALKLKEEEKKQRNARTQKEKDNEDVMLENILQEILDEEDEEETQGMDEETKKEYLDKKEKAKIKRKKQEAEIEKRQEEYRANNNPKASVRLVFKNEIIIDLILELLKEKDLGDFQKVTEKEFYIKCSSIENAEKLSREIQSIERYFNKILLKSLESEPNWLEEYRNLKNMSIKYNMIDYHNTSKNSILKYINENKEERSKYKKDEAQAIKTSLSENIEDSKTYLIDYLHANFEGIGSKRDIEELVNKIYNYMMSVSKDKTFFDTDLELSDIIYSIQEKEQSVLDLKKEEDANKFFNISENLDNEKDNNFDIPLADKIIDYVEKVILKDFKNIKRKKENIEFKGSKFDYRSNGIDGILSYENIKYSKENHGSDIREKIANALYHYFERTNKEKFLFKLKESLKELSIGLSKGGSISDKYSLICKESHPFNSTKSNKITKNKGLNPIK